MNISKFNRTPSFLGIMDIEEYQLLRLGKLLEYWGMEKFYINDFELIQDTAS